MAPLPLPSVSCSLTRWRLPCLQTHRVLNLLQAVVIRETSAPHASRSNATTSLLSVTPMSPIPGPPSGMLPHVHCLQRIRSKIYLIDTYTHSHSQPRITPQLELIHHEAVSGLHKMPSYVAKSRTSTRGFTPVNTMTCTATGSGSSRIQVERAVKVRMLFMTPHSLGQVSLCMFFKCVFKV